ncbi:YML119W [Zygosaccharomyces parabailii]|nr:YML119W [Zygosaccharomyces parabailii]
MMGLDDGKPLDLSFPSTDLPEFDINSRSSSPTKRTLNNKKVLDLTSYYGSWEKSEAPGIPLSMPQTPVFPSNETKNKRSPQKMTKNSKSPLAGSPHRKGPKSNTPARTFPKYKEIGSILELDKVDPMHQEKSFIGRYFSDPIDLNASKAEDGKLKPIINTVSKIGKASPGNKTYKLSIPLLIRQDTHRALKNQIERVCRSKYNASQPLCLFGDMSIRYYRLGDLQSKFIEFLQKPRRPQPLLPLGRSLNGAGALNDSFDLSFDGKALDRSDIFRMVDSFSVALSDEDAEDESSFVNSSGRDILPAEMTGTVF